MSSTSLMHASPEPLPTEWVERLFARLAAIFGNRLANLYDGQPPQDVKREWAEALAGYRSDEIRRGLDECRTRAWPPALGEFCRMCRPCLDPERAWHEAVDGLLARDKGEVGEWTHPAVFRAACRLSLELRGGTYKHHSSRWQHVLSGELRAGWGEEIPKPAPRLEMTPSKGHGMNDVDATVRDRLAVLREHRQPADRLAWARQIVERHKAGEKVAHGTLKAAIAALGGDPS